MENMPRGTFTAKHLRAAAEVLKKNSATTRQINTLADVFDNVNPRFKRHLFIKAATR